MQFILIFINIWIWYTLFDIVVYAGTHQNPFLLILAVIGATYWYWRHPVFKEKIEKEED
jgi:hypothetical protein